MVGPLGPGGTGGYWVPLGTGGIFGSQSEIYITVGTIGSQVGTSVCKWAALGARGDSLAPLVTAVS